MALFPSIADAWRAVKAGFSDRDALEKKGFSDVVVSASDVGELYRRDGYHRIAELLGGGVPAWSGEQVSRRTANNLSIFHACNKMTSEGQAFMPLLMMRRDIRSRDVSEIWDHPIIRVLDMGNDDVCAMDLRGALTSHMAVEGNGFGRIHRRSGTNVAYDIEGLVPQQVGGGIEEPNKSGTRGRLFYQVATAGNSDKTYFINPGKPHDILHLRGMGDSGIWGMSVLAAARQSLGIAIAQEHNIGNFYAQGARLPYVLEMPKQFRDREEFKEWRTDYETVYREAHRAIILENGMTHKQTGLSMKDQQLLEARQWSVPEHCRWWLIPPALVGDSTKQLAGNVYELGRQFAMFALSFWNRRWEQNLWRCILTPEEKNQGIFFKHNLQHLMRGSFNERWTGYTQMLSNGVASINEVRAMEDWEPVPGLDGHNIQMQMVPAKDAFSKNPDANRQLEDEEGVND